MAKAVALHGVGLAFGAHVTASGGVKRELGKRRRRAAPLMHTMPTTTTRHDDMLEDGRRAAVAMATRLFLFWCS